MLDGQELAIQLQDDFESRLANSKVKVEKSKDIRGTTYTLVKDLVHYEFTVGKRWLGYELTVADEVIGFPVGIGEDTDNYDLGGRNTEITRKIFNEAIDALDAFLKGKILVGKSEGNYVIALPVRTQKFLVRAVQKRKKFWINYVSVDSKEISDKELSQMSFLHSIE